MDFKEVELANLPALGIVVQRLNVLRPKMKFIKAGHEFDFSLLRIYVETPNSVRFKVDIPDNLLNDLEKDSHYSPSQYRSELIGQLDQVIEAAISMRE
jgi:hypothetical protein